MKTKEQELTETRLANEQSAEYFNLLLREAGCESQWVLDTDGESNSAGTWFCRDTGGVTLESEMREYTHKLLTVKEINPDCAI